MTIDGQAWATPYPNKAGDRWNSRPSGRVPLPEVTINLNRPQDLWGINIAQKHRYHAKSLTVKRPSDILVILLAILWAPVPNPGKFFGQVVTIFHSLFFFIVLADSAGLSGEPPLLQAEIKPAAAAKPVA